MKTFRVSLIRHDGLLLAVMDAQVIPDGPKNRRTISAPLEAEVCARSHSTHIYIESGGVRPGEGALGASTQGKGVGITIGIAAALSIPVSFVTPAQWKRVVGLPPGSEKNRSRSEAIRRWPQHASWFARVRDDGRQESALIGLAGILLNGGLK